MTRLYRVPGGRFALLAPLFLLIVPFMVSGCSGSAESGATRGNQRMVPVVEAVQARHGNLPLTERLSGLVKARNQVELFPEISATVMQVYVENGSRVKKGDPLVRLRNTELKELLKQAEASLQIAAAQARQAEAEWQRLQGELKRATALASQNLISPTEFETIQTEATAAEASAELARARVEQAQATIDQRKGELSRTIIRAPVDGTVGTRHAEVGMLVTPNTRLFTIGQLDSVRIEVVLTDHMLSYIKEGQRSEIFSQSLSFGSKSAPVTRISPFLHPVAHSTIAEIDMPNPDGALRSGMFVTVDIHYGESEQATLIPLSALWESSATGAAGVYVCRDSLTGEPVAMLDGGRSGGLTDPVAFQFVPVEVVTKGKMNAGVIGIDSGSWVVTIGQDLLGSDTALARVRPVSWKWVEELQELQREDLLDEIIQRQQTPAADTALIGALPADNGAGA